MKFDQSCPGEVKSSKETDKLWTNQLEQLKPFSRSLFDVYF